MTGKTTTTKPAEAFDADRFLTEIENLSLNLEGDLGEAEQEVDKLEEALKLARQRVEFEKGKLKRAAKVLREAGLERIIGAKPHDEVLSKVLTKIKQGGWAKYQREGATDEQILLVLKTNWPRWGNPFGGRHYHEGGEKPAVWLNSSYRSGKPTFEGKALAAEVRRILNIPQPKKPAAAAAKPAAPKPAAKKAAKKKPAPKKSGGGSSTPPKQHQDEAARDAGERADDEGDDLDAAAWGATSTERDTFTAEELHLPPVHLEALLSGNLRGGSEIEGTVSATTERGEMSYAVILASVQRDKTVYTLHPVIPRDGWKEPVQSWLQRRSRHPNKAPEDVPLEGVLVHDNGDDRDWVLCDDADRLYVEVPRGAVGFDAAAATRAAKEAIAAGEQDPISKGVLAGVGAGAEPRNSLEEQSLLMDDRNVNADGVYVRGNRTINVSVGHKGCAVQIVVARGNDGRYRGAFHVRVGSRGHGHLPDVKQIGLESEAYCVRSVAHQVLNLVEGYLQHPHSPADAAALRATAKSLRTFIESNPACQAPRLKNLPPQKEKPPAAKAATAAGPTISVGGFTGESGEALGIKHEELRRRVCIPANDGKKPLSCTPVQVNWQWYAVTGQGSSSEAEEAHLTTLYKREDLFRRYGADTYRLRHGGYKPDADGWAGVQVLVGGDLMVMGPDYERRVLVWSRERETAPAAKAKQPTLPGFRPLTFGQWYSTFRSVYDVAVGSVGAHKKLDRDDARIHALYQQYPDLRPSDAARKFVAEHGPMAQAARAAVVGRKSNGAAAPDDPAAIAAAYQHAPEGQVMHA